ncbi:hypothetical protein IEQ34_004849 [Dendrobium chrysotoxum]|uniref:Uncharacterized protein n=1 Tax=Dendrobium chrysotoxum TaxID=161865 RepID=A0AAV7H6I4_DENCH|nr:hypothetical protein IEQ34_004849 [Dendrobium chrysotoxum]
MSDLTFPGPKLGPKMSWGGPAAAGRRRSPCAAPAPPLRCHAPGLSDSPGPPRSPSGPMPARLSPCLARAWPVLARTEPAPGPSAGRPGPRVMAAGCQGNCGRPSLGPELVASLVQAQGPSLQERDLLPSAFLRVCPFAIREGPFLLPGTLLSANDVVANGSEGANFHISNDVVATVPKRSDRASLPPPEYLTVSETSLRAGLRFPPPAELVEILKRCGVCLSQFSYRAMSVTVGLIALFRDRGAVLTPEHLLRMGRLTSDMQGGVTLRCKWILRRAGPVPNFVRNDWGLLEKWGKMRDLSAPLHVREEYIMRLLKVPDVKHLLYEVCYLNKYIEEEFLFKVGLSFDPGRSDARMASVEKVAVLEAENKRSQTLIAEKEAALMSFESSRVIEDFKKSIAFKIIIQDHVQEARDHIYEVEVKALEQQCLNDGFIQGF